MEETSGKKQDSADHKNESFGKTVLIYVHDLAYLVAVMMVIFLLLFCIGGTVLHVLNPAGIPLLDTMFEAASALTTTGFSMGVTSKLTFGGKIFIILLMMIGRLGPFTILLFLLSREKPGQLKYPAERVIIG